MNIDIKLTEDQFDALHELIMAEAYAAVADSRGHHINTDKEFKVAYEALVGEASDHE